MANEVGREYRLEVQSTIDATKTITAISKATTAVVSCASHGYANGDVVVLTNVQGMVEVNNLVARVANQASGTFELEGVNSTNFGTFTSGSVAEVTAFTTVTQSTGVDFGAGSAEEIDMTTLIDSTRVVDAGILSLPQITVNLFADPPATAQAAIEIVGTIVDQLVFHVFEDFGAFFMRQRAGQFAFRRRQPLFRPRLRRLQVLKFRHVRCSLLLIV